MNNSKRKNEDNFAPALVGASRALVATMMPELVRYGFNGITPAFVSLMSLLDATGDPSHHPGQASRNHQTSD